MTWAIVGCALATNLLLGLVVWLISLRMHDASVADRAWSLWAAAPAVVALLMRGPSALAPSAIVMIVLLAAWAVRLACFVTWRNRGHGEDRRYTAMREHHGARFWWISALTVFGLQSVLAWVVAAPLWVALGAPDANSSLNVCSMAGALIAAAGLACESVADAQLARFKADSRHRGQVMDRGLWRYSRHPNYFGECLFWWGLWLLALGIVGASAAGSVVSPLLMTWLLLRVSGVALLERDIADRRPAYRAYMQRTSAFIPWWPKQEIKA